MLHPSTSRRCARAIPSHRRRRGGRQHRKGTASRHLTVHFDPAGQWRAAARRGETTRRDATPDTAWRQTATAMLLPVRCRPTRRSGGVSEPGGLMSPFRRILGGIPAPLGDRRNAMGDEQPPQVQRNRRIQRYGLYPSARDIELASEVVHVGPDGVAATVQQFCHRRTGKPIEPRGVRALVVCYAEQMHHRDRFTL